MDETVKQFILGTLQEGRDFVLAQAPDVVQQMLGAALMTHAFVIVVFGTLSFPAVLLSRWSWSGRMWCGYLNDVPTPRCAAFALSVVFIVFAPIMTILSVHSLVKIAFFPKAYLIDLVLR